MKEQIYACCKELRLSTTFAENALSMSGTTPQEYLLSVLRAEMDYRNTKRKKLRLKQAGFDNLKTFEGYDFNKIIIPNTTSIDGIKSLDFMDRNENLILYGRNGAGKSHMATAIGVEACMQGKKVRFYKTATLVNELTDAKSEGSLTVFCKPFLYKIAKCFCRLLQLHFVGDCKASTDSYSASRKTLQTLFNCYSTRYGNGSSEFSSSCACSLK